MLNIFKTKPQRVQPVSSEKTVSQGRAYVIGDIHGCFDAMKDLLVKIEADIKTAPISDVKIIFLGDLIDRGPHSREVVDYLMTYKPSFAELVFISGNHEEVMLKVLDGNLSAVKSWFQFGGRECVRSYGVDNLGEIHLHPDRLVERIQKAVPQTHYEFIKGFRNYYIYGRYLCVHAGIRPKVSLEEQSSTDLRWIRDSFLNYRKPHPYIIVHGHTIVPFPEHHSNRIAIDTGGYTGNPLTAVRLEGHDVTFIQSHA